MCRIPYFILIGMVTIVTVTSALDKTCSCPKGWISDFDELLSEVLLKIRERFDVQIHFDDFSSCLVNCLLKNSNKLTKRDSGYADTLKPVTLRKCSKFDDVDNVCYRSIAPAVAHFILLDDPWNFDTCCGSNLKIIHQDILIVASKEFKKKRLLFKTSYNQSVYDADPFESFWNQKNMDISGGVYVLEVAKESVKFYEVCYYCGEYQRKLVKLCKMKKEERLENDHFYFRPLSFENFNGHVFRLGFSYGKLHLHFTNSTVVIDDQGEEAIRCHPCLGPGGLLITEMAKRLNFQFNLYHHPLDNTPTIAPSDLIIEYILNGDLDWGVGGITYTADRRNKVDFLSFLLSDPYTVLYYSKERNLDRIKVILKPFDTTVWLAIGLSILLIWIFFKFSTIRSNVSRKHPNQLTILNVIGVLAEHPINGYIYPSIRLQVAMWLLLSISLDAIYKTRLASIAIKPSEVKKISLDHMSENGYTFLIDNSTSTFGMALLNSSLDNRMRNFFRHSRNDIDFCQGLRYMMTENAVIFDEKLVLWMNLMTLCSSDVRVSKEVKNFYIYPEIIVHSYQSWPMRKNTPFQGSFNHIIARIKASGIFQRWIDNDVTTTMMRKFVYDSKLSPTIKALQIKDVLGAFSVLFIGFLGSLVWFTFEVFLCRGRSIYL